MTISSVKAASFSPIWTGSGARAKAARAPQKLCGKALPKCKKSGRRKPSACAWCHNMPKVCHKWFWQGCRLRFHHHHHNTLRDILWWGGWSEEPSQQPSSATISHYGGKTPPQKLCVLVVARLPGTMPHASACEQGRSPPAFFFVLDLKLPHDDNPPKRKWRRLRVHRYPTFPHSVSHARGHAALARSRSTLRHCKIGGRPVADQPIRNPRLAFSETQGVPSDCFRCRDQNLERQSGGHRNSRGQRPARRRRLQAFRTSDAFRTTI